MSELATKAPKVKKEPVVLTVEGILADLDAGFDREKIKAKYGLSHSDMALLFKDPALKGRKPKGATRTKKAPGFILVGATVPAPANTTSESITEGVSGIVSGIVSGTVNEIATSETKVTEEPAIEPGEALDKW